ncbi:MAG: TIGR04282 family arsenosugar biosynthesis glycosyltransferase [Cyclobacteriaceae bacterium]
MIFVKNLIPGMVKTRLAKDIGIDAALDIYKQLIEQTNEVADKITTDKTIYYSEYVEIEDIWDTEKYSLKVQKGNDLGEKMLNAFDEAFDSYNKVVLIGSDCFDLTPETIANAFKSLEDFDVVVGPASDGGYYLLGMKEHLPQLFQGKEYSTDKVLQELLAEAEELELSVHQLEELNDIDTLQDLKDAGVEWETEGEQIEGSGEPDL